MAHALNGAYAWTAVRASPATITPSKNTSTDSNIRDFQEVAMEMRLWRVVPAVIVLWLLIGALAAGQRGYYSGSTNCSATGKVAATILAGPLNYVGVNPKTSCLVPQPSK
jgi:hypothetical protein